MGNQNVILLAGISRAYDIARKDNDALLALRIPAGVRVLQVDAYEACYFTRTSTEEMHTGLSLSKLESLYIKYDGRGLSLYVQDNNAVLGDVK